MNCSCCQIAGKAGTTRKEKTAGQREDDLRCTASHTTLPLTSWTRSTTVYLFFSDTFPEEENFVSKLPFDKRER